MKLAGRGEKMEEREGGREGAWEEGRRRKAGARSGEKKKAKESPDKRPC